MFFSEGCGVKTLKVVREYVMGCIPTPRMPVTIRIRYDKIIFSVGYPNLNLHFTSHILGACTLHPERCSRSFL